jgi:hypothetical protein
LENASIEWTHPDLFRRVADLRQRGWTFVFLGANQDSYERCRDADQFWGDRKEGEEME